MLRWRFHENVRICAIPAVAFLVIICGSYAQRRGLLANPAPASRPAATGNRSASGKVVLYAAVGAELTQYDVDVDTATLVKRGSIMLPANVQEAVAHPSRQYLYIAWSNGGPSHNPPRRCAPQG